MNTNRDMSGSCGRGRFRPGGWRTLLLSLCLLAVACAEPSADGFGGTAGDEAVVRLTISLPQAELPVGRERAATRSEEAENLISTVRVLVFEEVDGRYLYRYMSEGERLQVTGSTTSFEAKLTGTDKTVKLLIAGNYGDAFANYAPAAGSDEATVRSGLGCSFAGLTGNLPMYGEVTLPNGLVPGVENRFDIRMLRAVARVDVEKELDADSRSFRIASVAVYRPNDRIQIAPNRLASADTPQVTEPSVPPGAGKSPVPVGVAAAEADPSAVGGIYVPEAAGETDAAAQLSDATCIVVGGYYDGASELSYYRIDFNPGVEGHPFGQVLRNHKYVFRIKKVTGTGWSDAASAAENRATSIVAQVEAWEDFTTEMYFDGDNYLGVSSRTLTLGYVAGKSGRVDVQATVPYTIQWLDASGVPTGTAVTGVGTTLTGNSNFTVSIGRDAGADDAVSYLLFTASQDNRTDRNVVSRLRVSGGRWTFDITVTQENPSLYKDRIIRVLSVHEIGSLGTGTPSSASGMALRRILDNTKNFSPTGTVVVGGFAFTEVSNVEMQAVSTGVLEIFNSIKRIINAQDVIYLTYNTAISDELAQAVLAWLRADTGRVLIVGTDTEATNAKLRQYLTSDGTWKYYYQNNIGGNFKRAAQTDANRRFFMTPFGQVAENAVVSRADNYAAYCSDYPSAVTPLLVSTAAGQEKTLSVGVNQTSRIVYLGDANLNQNGSLSTQANATGTVTTDFDRLTANLWAWIVEQVCQNG